LELKRKQGEMKYTQAGLLSKSAEGAICKQRVNSGLSDAARRNERSGEAHDSSGPVILFPMDMTEGGELEPEDRAYDETERQKTRRCLKMTGCNEAAAASI